MYAIRSYYAFDPTFGNGTGQVRGCCAINYITSIALQPDGKIVTVGGYVPALSEVFEATERLGLWVADMEVLRP